VLDVAGIQRSPLLGLQTRHLVQLDEVEDLAPVFRFTLVELLLVGIALGWISQQYDAGFSPLTAGDERALAAAFPISSRRATGLPIPTVAYRWRQYPRPRSLLRRWRREHTALQQPVFDDFMDEQAKRWEKIEHHDRHPKKGHVHAHPRHHRKSQKHLHP
jgi:hypothetical protein